VTKIGAATATVGADGIKLTTGTSSDADKVSWQDSIKPVSASTVTELSYETVKLDSAGPGVNDAALPAYHVFVKTPKGAGTLVYEPYWNLGNANPPRGLRIEWDVLKGKLWTPSQNVIVGLPKTAGGPATKTFAEVVAENPKMTVTGIGFGLGTYNRGVVSVLDEQRIATKNSCYDHQWSTGFQNGPWWPGWLRRS
jgi:hypothetical protein